MSEINPNFEQTAAYWRAVAAFNSEQANFHGSLGAEQKAMLERASVSANEAKALIGSVCPVGSTVDEEALQKHGLIRCIPAPAKE